MPTARVTIRFRGRQVGSPGAICDMEQRRTVTLPSPFTLDQAHEAARKALRYRQGDSPAYERVTVRSVAFN